jgi:hypothetical protein
MLVFGSSAGKDGLVALSDEERAILDFERTWWTEDGPKEALIEERFGFAADHYYQSLNGLLERPEALEHDPLVVRRLLRLRDRRRRLRLGPPPSPAAAASVEERA